MKGFSNLDAKIHEQITKTTHSLPPRISSIYKIGDIVKVKVDRIVDFGVFVTFVDEYNFSGLVHKSNLANQFVEDTEDFLEEDQEIEAKIVSFKKDQGVEKAELSLKHLNLQPKKNILAKQLSPLKDQWTHQEKDGKHTESPYAIDEEFEALYQLITEELGMISSKSKKKIQELATQHGLVKVTMMIIEHRERFVKDLTWHYVKEVEQKLSDSL